MKIKSMLFLNHQCLLALINKLHQVGFPIHHLWFLLVYLKHQRRRAQTRFQGYSMSILQYVEKAVTKLEAPKIRFSCLNLNTVYRVSNKPCLLHRRRDPIRNRINRIYRINLTWMEPTLFKIQMFSNHQMEVEQIK